MLATLPTLSQSRAMRFFTFSALYFCEGIPFGLMGVALAPWLMQSGMTKEAVATFKAFSQLPWSFKPAVAPLMDACTCPSLGFRRPWVVGLMFGLVVSLLTLAATSAASVTINLSVLTICGFAINLFGASMDVAVDGMAIYILHADELSRANSLMAAGQVIGGSILGALCGFLLPIVGLGGTAATCAVVLLPGFVLVLAVLERPGERHLPDSKCSSQHTTGPTGSQPPVPHAQAEAVSLISRLMDMVHRLCFQRASVVLLSVMMIYGMSGGISSIIWPKAFLDAGVSAATYAAFMSATGLVAAMAVIPAGSLFDQVGPHVCLQLALVVKAALSSAVALIGTPNAAQLYAVTVVSALAAMVNFVCYLTLAMNLCSSSLAAATQFAIMMACSNFSHVLGDALVAAHILSEQREWFWLMAALEGLAALLAFALPPLSAAKKEAEGELV